MPIYFATNRDVVLEGTSNAELGERFNADGPQFFRVGVCKVVLQPENAAAPSSTSVTQAEDLRGRRAMRAPS